MQAWIEPILNFIFPKQCVGCRQVGSYFCYECLSKISQTELVCPMCERASFGGITHPVCRRRYGLDGLWSLGVYDGILKLAIHKMKYNFVKEFGEILAKIVLIYWANKGSSLLEQIIKSGAEEWVLVPVPLHKYRKNWRGFNQAELIAQTLSEKLGIEYANVLIRVKNTKPQFELKAESRKSNINGAFALSKTYNLKPITYILVDDVWTTGSTLKECCYILKKNGAKSVWALTVAR